VPAHDDAWLRSLAPRVELDTHGTKTLTWTHFAPAGFEFEVVISQPPDGEPKVIKASASYASD